MDAAQPANYHVIFDHAVARNSGRIHHNNPIANLRVMRDVTTRHKQPIVANASHATATFGARVHRDMFANAIARANHKAALFALKLQILWHFANHSKRKHHGVLADLGVTGQNHVAFQLNPFTQHNIGTNNAEWADNAACLNDSTIFDYGASVYLRSAGN
jgi:hypothetical protein